MDFGVATQVPGGFSSYDAFDQHSNWFAANNNPLAFNFDAAAATLDFNPYDYTASIPLPAMQYPCLPHDQQHIAAARRPSNASYPTGRNHNQAKRASRVSERPHYAIEKRYRSTLNHRFAALADLIAQPATQQLCQAQYRGENADDKPAVLQHIQFTTSTGQKQSKTTTLTRALQTIVLLERSCLRKTRRFDARVSRLNQMIESRQSEREPRVRSRESGVGR